MKPGTRNLKAEAWIPKQIHVEDTVDPIRDIEIITNELRKKDRVRPSPVPVPTHL